MEYVVLDLEWNQPDSSENTVRKPVTLRGEIIQIGAVRLNENAEATDSFSALIKPVYYTGLNEFVSELTHITREELSKGLPFCQAMDSFMHWCPEEFVFLTWSNNDIRMLKQNLLVYGRDTSSLPPSVDLQSLFSRYVLQEKRCCSLTQAVSYIASAEFVAHNALNDALATAEIARYLKLHGVSFSAAKSNKKSGTENGIYTNAKAARKAQQNREFVCTRCGRTVSCIWLSNHTNKCISLPQCACGTEYFVRLTIKPAKAPSVTATRTVSPATDSDKEFFQKKQAQERIKEANRRTYWYTKSKNKSAIKS